MGSGDKSNKFISYHIMKNSEISFFHLVDVASSCEFPYFLQATKFASAIQYGSFVVWHSAGTSLSEILAL